jgi:hypothetical protein
MQEKIEHRPFEETIVDATNLCISADELLGIFWLIQNTTILFGHDAIVEALQGAARRISEYETNLLIAVVVRDVLEQKREAEAEKKKQRDRRIAEAINEACDHR